MRVKSWCLLLLSSLLALAATPAVAEDDPNWYTVEVIVFLHREDAAPTDERWPSDPGTPDVEAATTLHPPTVPAALIPYEQIPPRALRLGGAYRTLDRSSRYQALLHVGWMQPGLPRTSAIPLRIDDTSGRPLATIPLEVELPPEPVAVEQVPDPLASEPGSDSFEAFDLGDDAWPEAGPEPEPVMTLTGTVTLAQQRFLHVDVDLLYTSGEVLPVGMDDANDSPWRYRLDDDIIWSLGSAVDSPRYQGYRLRDSRRIRSEELHYFDHPKFGVIVAVHPVPADEAEARRDAYETAYRAALLQREAERLLRSR